MIWIFLSFLKHFFCSLKSVTFKMRKKRVKKKKVNIVGFCMWSYLSIHPSTIYKPAPRMIHTHVATGGLKSDNITSSDLAAYPAGRQESLVSQNKAL